MSILLSAVIIAKNAANVLPDCLASLDLADEIILLDSGSKDNTIALARAAGVKVFINTDWQGYGIQRQRAQQYATGDYILMIDVDERLTTDLKQSIQNVLKLPLNHNIVYSVVRRNYFLGKFIRHSGLYPDKVIRLYARKSYQYDDRQVHESLVCSNAQVISLQGDLLHLTCCNFSDFQKKQLRYAIAWASEQYHQGKKTLFTSILIHTLGVFFKTLILRGGILDGKRGWLIAIMNAQYTFNKYTELWTLCTKTIHNKYEKK